MDHLPPNGPGGGDGAFAPAAPHSGLSAYGSPPLGVPSPGDGPSLQLPQGSAPAGVFSPAGVAALSIPPQTDLAPLDPVAPRTPARQGLDFGPGSLPPVPEHFSEIAAPPPGVEAIPGRPGPPSMYDQAVGQMAEGEGHMLGLSVIGVSAGVAAGTYYGGAYGGIAGGLIAGSVLNAYRAVHYYQAATEASDKEAQVSGTYAVAGGVIAAVIWAKLASKSPRAAMWANKRQEGATSDAESPPADLVPNDGGTAAGCNFRPVI